MLDPHSSVKASVVCGTQCKNISAVPMKASFADQVQEFFIKFFNTADWPDWNRCSVT
jgi:hypothetical protein